MSSSATPTLKFSSQLIYIFFLPWGRRPWYSVYPLIVEKYCVFYVLGQNMADNPVLEKLNKFIVDAVITIPKMTLHFIDFFNEAFMLDGMRFGRRIAVAGHQALFGLEMELGVSDQEFQR